MGTIKAVMDKYLRAYRSLDSLLPSLVSETSDVILDLNRDQLLQGRDADGNLLYPTYLNDPYFKSYKAAERYSRMKYLLESRHIRRMSFPLLYGEKPTDVPNLIVRGNFHEGMFIRVSKDSYTIDSSYTEADDINAKYRHRVYGLAPKSVEYYYFGWIRPRILNHYKNTK